MKQKREQYERFLRAKMLAPRECGVEIEAGEIHPLLKPHQRDIVQWCLRGGCRAIFAAFGLGKTFMQLTIASLLVKRIGGRFLIAAPLGVRMEFFNDAETLGIPIQFVQSDAEIGGDGIYLTNYESVREGKIRPDWFVGISLDEASLLRSFGSKTFGEFLFGNFAKVRYRFVATATPSPNDYVELLAYAHFLGVMHPADGITARAADVLGAAERGADSVLFLRSVRACSGAVPGLFGNADTQVRRARDQEADLRRA